MLKAKTNCTYIYKKNIQPRGVHNEEEEEEEEANQKA